MGDQTKKKKKSSRSSVKYPALDPAYNLKSRQEEIEDLYSYKDQLNESEKEWLNSFAEEEINSNFNHKGVKLNDQTDPKVRSRIYTRNNERNRCIQTLELAKGMLMYLEEIDIDNEGEAFKEEVLNELEDLAED